MEQHLKTLSARSLPSGGFANRSGGRFRPDATAWAILALVSAGAERDLCIRAAERLAQAQMDDGRVPLSRENSGSYWPTAAVVLAWHGLGLHEKEKEKGLHFLLGSSGKHWEPRENQVTKADPSILGWSWVEDTFSWIVPTSDSMVALKACGYGDHPRVREGADLLLDRQLPSGGWNYGNVSVFGTVLEATPESTGHALCALAGLAQEGAVEKSIGYLERQAGRLRTPLSLVWATFALRTWGRGPVDPRGRAEACLAHQERYGPYETILLAQLILDYSIEGDLGAFLRGGARRPAGES